MNRSSSFPLLWLLSPAAVSALCIYVNLGGAWMGDPARLENVIATALYLLFWLGFTLSARSSPTRLKCCAAMAFLTLVTAVIRLLVHTAGLDLLMLPALLLTLFFSVPLYGLRYLANWTVLDLTSLLFSGLWLLYTCKQLHKI